MLTKSQKQHFNGGGKKKATNQQKLFKPKASLLSLKIVNYGREV